MVSYELNGVVALEGPCWAAIRGERVVALRQTAAEPDEAEDRECRVALRALGEILHGYCADGRFHRAGGCYPEVAHDRRYAGAYIIMRHHEGVDWHPGIWQSHLGQNAPVNHHWLSPYDGFDLQGTPTYDFVEDTHDIMETIPISLDHDIMVVRLPIQVEPQGGPLGPHYDPRLSAVLTVGKK